MTMIDMQYLRRWLAAAVVISCSALLLGVGVAWSTADEPKTSALADLRDAVQMADKRGVNVAEIQAALENLEKALQQGLKLAPDQADPPKELLALREAVEAAARKGENVEAIRKELEAVEKQLIGRTLQVERPPLRPVDPPERPGRPRFPLGDGGAIGPPGFVLPGLPGRLPGIDRELFDKAQKLREDAFRLLLENPNDPEALRKLEEATQLMLQAIGGGRVLPDPGFDGDGFPPLFPQPAERPRLGIRMQRIPEALAEQLGLEPNRGILVTDVLPDTPAEKAGFKVHDIVLDFAGKPVPDDPEAFARQVQSVKAGEKVSAVVLRKGQRVELKDITLPEIKREDRPRPRIPDRFRGGIEPGFDFGGFPAFPFPDPAFPLLGGGFVPKARSVSVTFLNGRFTIKAVDNGVQYTIIGVQDDLKPIEKIQIVDGDKKVEADDIDKLPEKYRPVVKELLQQYMFPPLQNLFQFPKEDLKPNQEPRLKDNREKKKD
jgi:serine protease Do